VSTGTKKVSDVGQNLGARFRAVNDAMTIENAARIRDVRSGTTRLVNPATGRVERIPDIFADNPEEYFKLFPQAEQRVLGKNFEYGAGLRQEKITTAAQRAEDARAGNIFEEIAVEEKLERVRKSFSPDGLSPMQQSIVSGNVTKPATAGSVSASTPRPVSSAIPTNYESRLQQAIEDAMRLPDQEGVTISQIAQQVDTPTKPIVTSSGVPTISFSEPVSNVFDSIPGVKPISIKPPGTRPLVALRAAEKRGAELRTSFENMGKEAPDFSNESLIESGVLPGPRRRSGSQSSAGVAFESTLERQKKAEQIAQRIFDREQMSKGLDLEVPKARPRRGLLSEEGEVKLQSQAALGFGLLNTEQEVLAVIQAAERGWPDGYKPAMLVPQSEIAGISPQVAAKLKQLEKEGIIYSNARGTAIGRKENVQRIDELLTPETKPTPESQAEIGRLLGYESDVIELFSLRNNTKDMGTMGIEDIQKQLRAGVRPRDLINEFKARSLRDTQSTPISLSATQVESKARAAERVDRVKKAEEKRRAAKASGSLPPQPRPLSQIDEAVTSTSSSYRNRTFDPKNPMQDAMSVLKSTEEELAGRVSRGAGSLEGATGWKFRLYPSSPESQEAINAFIQRNRELVDQAKFLENKWTIYVGDKKTLDTLTAAAKKEILDTNIGKSIVDPTDLDINQTGIGARFDPSNLLENPSNPYLKRNLGEEFARTRRQKTGKDMAELERRNRKKFESEGKANLLGEPLYQDEVGLHSGETGAGGSYKGLPTTRKMERLLAQTDLLKRTGKDTSAIEKSIAKEYELMGETFRRIDPSNFYSGGGLVYANKGTMVAYQPKGTDRIPAMLSKGEYVMNNAATANNLPALNYMNNGGIIKPKYMDNGGPLGSTSSPSTSSSSSFNGSYSVSLEDKSRTFMETFANSLNTFGKDFNAYITELAKIKIPDKIEMVGKHTVEVNVTGAAAFEAMEEGVKNLINKEIGIEMNALWEQSGGQLGRAN